MKTLSPEQVQEAVDFIVWEAGTKFPHDPKYTTPFLKRFKLQRGQITDEMIDRAHRHAKLRLRNGLIDFNRIARGRGIRRQFVMQGDPELDPEMNPEMEGTAKYRAQIEADRRAAMIARLTNLRKKSEPSFENGEYSNDRSITTTTERGKTMDIRIDKARTLLADLGIEESSKWSVKKIADKLNAITEVLDKATKDPDGDSAKMLTAISASLKEGVPIMVVDTGDDGGVDAVVSKAKKKKPAAPSPSKKGSRKGTFLKDWGPCETTEAFKVFSKMQKSKKNAADLGEALGLTEKRILRHVCYWKERGAPIKDKGGVLTLE